MGLVLPNYRVCVTGVTTASGQVHVTLVTAASSGTHTRAMGWQAARPCADTGAPVNEMWIPERGLGDTDGVSVKVCGGASAHRLLGTKRPQMVCVAAWVWFCLSTEFVVVPLR